MEGSPLFEGGLSSIPRLTRWMLFAFIGASILNALLALWLGVVNLAEWAALEPERVLHGEVWRLVTYPWIAVHPYNLLFGALMIFFFAAPMERSWGRQRFWQRTLALIVLPGVLTTLLALAVPPLRMVPFLGISALTLAYVTAFASEMRGASIGLLFLPISFGGDQLLLFEGAMLLLWILFSGAVLPYMNDIFAFAVGLAWFRFDLSRDLRRSWLRYRKSQLESKITKLKRERNLRVIKSDDDEDGDGNRYLH